MLKITGKNINLRLVNVEDAQFILDLRLKKGEHLSSTQPNLQNQKDWIGKYKNRENKNEEYYFIIESKKEERLGTVRLYDFNNNSFCWGSWIIKDNSPYYTSIESALLVYDLAFNDLKFTNCHFDVRKNNISVVNFHKRFGAKIIKEDDLDYFFNLSVQDYQASKEKYKKFTCSPF